MSAGFATGVATEGVCWAGGVEAEAADGVGGDDPPQADHVIAASVSAVRMTQVYVDRQAWSVPPETKRNRSVYADERAS